MSDEYEAGPGRGGRHWLAEEDATLRRDWGLRRPEYIALQLGRTPAACKVRAHRLRRKDLAEDLAAREQMLIRSSLWRRLLRWLRLG